MASSPSGARAHLSELGPAENDAVSALTSMNSAPQSAPPEYTAIDARSRVMFTIPQNNTPITRAYKVRQGDLFCRRYQILQGIGRGRWGTVVRVFDHKMRRLIALKVMHISSQMSLFAAREEYMVEFLSRNDVKRCRKFTKFLGAFSEGPFRCIAFDLYGVNLASVINSKEIMPLPNRHVQAIARQLILGLSYLHGLGIIHTDIKPINILLASSDTIDIVEVVVDGTTITKRTLRNPDIRISDFGFAIMFNERHHPGVGSNQYRAPEICLGNSWSFPIDVFAAACTIIDIATGKPLFYVAEDDRERLASIERAIGLFPRNIIPRSVADVHRTPFFSLTDPPRVLFPLGPNDVRISAGVLRVMNTLTLNARVPDKQLRVLLYRMLTLDPELRITAHAAPSMPYFRNVFT